MSQNNGADTNKYRKMIGSDGESTNQQMASRAVSDAKAPVPTKGGQTQSFAGTEQPGTKTTVKSSSKKY